MSLTRLVLTDFRNHADALLTPGPGFVVLTGENGAGKTNVLEAVSLLAPGRGLRRAPLAEMARQGAPAASASLRRWATPRSARATRPDAPERRLVRINSANAAATALVEWLTVLWLTPAMDRLFVEGPGERRRFLDRLTLALAPGHAHHATRYEAAMRQRNRILAELGGVGAQPDAAWLGALEARMAEHGAAIAEARAAAVTALGERLAGQPDGPFARAGLALEGWSGDAGQLARELAEGRRRDAAAARTLAGPHRSDLRVTHLGKDQPAQLCSTGEQKALLLGLVLAHAELVAERTGRRRSCCSTKSRRTSIPAAAPRCSIGWRGGGQVWMTGTEPALFGAIGGDATRYRVAEGRIE